MSPLRLLLLPLLFLSLVYADDGYGLWLNHRRLEDETLRRSVAHTVRALCLATPSEAHGATRHIAVEELQSGLEQLAGVRPPLTHGLTVAEPALGEEGYRISLEAGTLTLSANTELGLLHGAFAVLRGLEEGRAPQSLAGTSAPRIQRRILNHWDNLNRSMERVMAGQSLWEWFNLPEVVSPRYRDYARACASVGINGSVLTNVNANARVLSADYLAKVAVLANEFRPYGVRVYLTARFSAPLELGGLQTADPASPEVAAWWRTKCEEIYRLIPDFGGFLVKANSEGQPGPQNYGRNHADGANMLADALAPHGGIVLWRAFVYEPHPGVDRLLQAHLEFAPLDGAFRPNVVIQVKNGPLDFMPREPFHPLFGAMPRTPLALEVQITQEYLGGATQLAFLAPLWKEVLDADTHCEGSGSTVARIVDGSLGGMRHSAISGVANVGTDRNWTGHPLAQANWYAFGRLAWDPSLSSERIAHEWARQTFPRQAVVTDTITRMLLGSRETVVNYSMPLGLHHIMAEGHHHGPGPWVVSSRPDWGSAYYHQASATGLGADRGPAGSNALSQYAPPLRALWGNVETCPENLLLWFHHLPWSHRMKSGRSLWDELCLRYQRGVDEVGVLRRDWAALAPHLDSARHVLVGQLLLRQELEAREWRDACLGYFASFSRLPLPRGVEPAPYPWEHYKLRRLHHVPGDPADH